jgi:hypothetical protein
VLGGVVKRSVVLMVVAITMAGIQNASQLGGTLINLLIRSNTAKPVDPSKNSKTC